jgi:CRISPR/Cas system-associated protein endoribonuclease Cas2
MINKESSLEAYRLAMKKLFDDIQPLGKVPILQGSSKQTAPLKLLFGNIKLRQTIIKHQF